MEPIVAEIAVNDENRLERLVRRFGPNVVAPVIAGVVAIAVSSLALLAGGYNPLGAFQAIGEVLWRPEGQRPLRLPVQST